MDKTKILFAFPVLAIAVLHFVTSFFVAFAAGISESQPLKIAANILTFPLHLIPKGFDLPGLLSWLPWAALSLCWGLGVCVLVRAVAANVK